VNFLKKFLKKPEYFCKKDGTPTKFYYFYEALYFFLFKTNKETETAPHIRDALDMKRLMVTVVVALIPAVIMALYNTGLQANLVIDSMSSLPEPNWQRKVIEWLGIGFDPNNIFANLTQGALYFFPLYIVVLAVGGFWEVVFAMIRKHPINEGFLVTSLLFPLIVPPDLPYWQAALGISFGVVIGKEVFGGVGMNIVNPALAGRVFLFFAYPAQISGDKVWIALDNISQATPLAQMADKTLHLSYSWMDSFLGFIPGSMGETSTLACLIGAVILIVTGIGSWRIMLSVLAGMVSFSLLFNLTGSTTNPMFQVTPWWHLVTGGFAFGMVFMATDPVSAAFTHTGKYLYGLLIGFLVVLIRVVNPAYPEGMMLAILFGNIFSPIIDRFVINAHIKKRKARYG